MARAQDPRQGSTPFVESDWERVGETLRTLRELRGFEPDEFASAIGISPVMRPSERA